MIQIANPLWLWGLAGLIVPVAIHLLSRREGKTIPFGSLRFLDETPSSQFRGIRLNEILLLIVRSLCIVVLVLFLAGVTIKNKTRSKLLLIEDSLVELPVISGLVDSLTGEGYQTKKISEHVHRDTNQTQLNYWSVIEELAHQPYESVVVIGTPLFRYFRGERVPLPEHVHWIPVAETSRDTFELFSIRQSGGTYKRVGYTTGDETHFRTIHGGDGTGPSDSIHVRIVWDSKFEREKDWFVAALTAVGTLYKPVALQLNPNTNDPVDWTILLTKGPHQKGKNMIISANAYYADADIFIQDSVGGAVNNIWIFNPMRDISLALEKDFVGKLSKILTSSEMSLQEKPDYRIMPDGLMWASVKGEPPSVKTQAKNAARAPWLLLLFVAALFAERILSKYRRQ